MIDSDLNVFIGQAQGEVTANEAREAEQLLILDDPTGTLEELFLCDENFPKGYVQFAHPQDYQPTPHPIPVERIFHSHDSHFRLILRISVKLSPTTCVPMSFVLDTGCPGYLYLGERAEALMTAFGVLKRDDDFQTSCVNWAGRRLLVQTTPRQHGPANVIGLRALCLFGLQLHASPFGYSFSCPMDELVLHQ